MDGNTKSAGNKANDFIARQRIAATGKLDQAAVQSFYDNAALGLSLLFGANQRFIQFFLFTGAVNTQIILFDSGDNAG